MKNKNQGISVFTLKIIAYLLMIFNHVCYAYFKFVNNSSSFLVDFHWYLTRGSFIIFAFLISEGMVRTRSQIKYLARLGIFAVISEVPYDLCMSQTFFDTSSQNVYFTLFFGGLIIYLFEIFKNKKIIPVLLSLGIIYLSYLIKCDYSYLGIIVILSFYYFRKNKLKRLLFTGIIFAITTFIYYLIEFYVAYNFIDIQKIVHYFVIEVHGLAIFPLLIFYHGKKGPNINKYLFYLIYPVHLILIAVLIYFLK